MEQFSNLVEYVVGIIVTIAMWSAIDYFWDDSDDSQDDKDRDKGD